MLYLCICLQTTPITSLRNGLSLNTWAELWRFNDSTSEQMNIKRDNLSYPVLALNVFVTFRLGGWSMPQRIRECAASVCCWRWRSLTWFDSPSDYTALSGVVNSTTSHTVGSQDQLSAFSVMSRSCKSSCRLVDWRDERWLRDMSVSFRQTTRDKHQNAIVPLALCQALSGRDGANIGPLIETESCHSLRRMLVNWIKLKEFYHLDTRQCWFFELDEEK